MTGMNVMLQSTPGTGLAVQSLILADISSLQIRCIAARLAISVRRCKTDMWTYAARSNQPFTASYRTDMGR